jgi:hypothetical protein
LAMCVTWPVYLTLLLLITLISDEEQLWSWLCMCSLPHFFIRYMSDQDISTVQHKCKPITLADGNWTAEWHLAARTPFSCSAHFWPWRWRW